MTGQIVCMFCCLFFFVIDRSRFINQSFEKEPGSLEPSSAQTPMVDHDDPVLFSSNSRTNRTYREHGENDFLFYL